MCLRECGGLYASFCVSDRDWDTAFVRGLVCMCVYVFSQKCVSVYVGVCKTARSREIFNHILLGEHF